MRKTTWFVISCSAVLSILACSATPGGGAASGDEASTAANGKDSDSTPTGTSTSSAPDVPSSTASTPPAPSTSTSTSTTTNPDDACGSLTGDDACDTCCSANHASGSAVFDDAWYACVCTPTACQTVCGTTDCSDDDNAPSSTDGDACSLCEEQFAPWDGTGACGAQITAACNGSADCKAYHACADNCP